MAERYSGKHSGGYNKKSKLIMAGSCTVIFALVIVLLFGSLGRAPIDEDPTAPAQKADLKASAGKPLNEEETLQEPILPEPEPEPEEEIYQEEPEQTVYPEFRPHCTENTKPEKLIVETGIEADGEVVESIKLDSPISFGIGSQYTDIPGLFAFRADNFRANSAYGVSSMKEKKMEEIWTEPVSSLTAPNGVNWSGTGWTGQPLIAQWPKSTRQIMNLYDWAKEQDVLTEVIYAAEDGRIYFNELETGKQTRDTLFLGYTCKGSGSLDPRGYPVLYVGAGYQSNYGSPRAFAISLIDCKTLFDFGCNDPFAKRAWFCFDASPLVDAETDTLIWPGESGILYLIRLNSQYDEQSGTLTMDPTYIKWRYKGDRNDGWYYGMEDSPTIWQGYLFIADNSGYMMCINLETLELVWVQDLVDDTNCSPALELEDGHPYLYMSTSFHLGWRSWSTADIPVCKLDAETGEIIWQKSYNCYSEDGVSGGVQGSIAIGKKKLKDLVFVPMAKTGNAAGGKIIAMQKSTGEVVWECMNNSYTWGSPTIVYDKAGNGYILYATLMGDLLMLDGSTGEIINQIDLAGHCESTVAAFNDYFVIGCRTGYIHGFQLK